MLVAVLGSAIMLWLHPTVRFPIALAYPVSLPVWFLIALTAVNVVLALDFVTALVVLLRRLEYGGMPRPAEWLAILLATWLLSMTPPNVDDLINSILQWTARSNSFWVWRWIVAGFAFAGCVICLAASWTFRRHLPEWTSTVLLATVAFVLLWAPLWVVEQQLPDLFPRWPGKDAGWAFWFYFETCRVPGCP
jgi:hypothetical protein